ncbi:MAG: ferritin family protein [Deltaproteobacteria bacterium]|nr:ferritin family protein [Deltaproteobacteria bacterium]MBW2013167.1 ferritin family protein [Deltaproteobacteria bacterium]MBW2319579.1 ferritin family protein [Deltaproteobacteria bacterium]
MVYDFTANDVFEMAEQLERNGAKFYRTAAENVSDPKSKKLLIELAEMEDEHEKTFASLRADLTEGEKTTTVFDPEDESVLYLRALADTRVFFKKKIDISSMKEILKAAIVAEKDSIVFYLGLKDFVPDRLGKNRLDKIIKEEMGHIRILSKELVSLVK